MTGVVLIQQRSLALARRVVATTAARLGAGLAGWTILETDFHGVLLSCVSWIIDVDVQ